MGGSESKDGANKSTLTDNSTKSTGFHLFEFHRKSVVRVVLVFMACAIIGFVFYKKVFKHGARAADCERANPTAFPPTNTANLHAISKHTTPSLRWDREETSPGQWQSLQHLLAAAASVQPYPAPQEGLYPDLRREAAPSVPRSNFIQREPPAQQVPRVPLDPTQLRAF